MIKAHVFCGGFFITPHFFNLLISFFVNDWLILFLHLNDYSKARSMRRNEMLTAATRTLTRSPIL